MSTQFGTIRDKRTKADRYIDATEIGERISICGINDTDDLLALDEENATRLIDGMRLAFAHNRWEWPG